MTDISIYIGLFLTAFMAATLLPAQSELMLSVLLATGDYSVSGLLGAAWCGNTLGSCLNWLLGSLFHRYKDRRWFPVKEKSLNRAERWYAKYGRWSLLLSWAPVIGDPLTLLAGVLREPFRSFVLIVGAAKLVRYLLVAALVLHWQ